MRVRIDLVLAAVLTAAPAFAFGVNWVTFVNETSTRLVSDPSVGANDLREKVHFCE